MEEEFSQTQMILKEQQGKLDDLMRNLSEARRNLDEKQQA